MDNDDAALIERCRAGDVAAFEPLVEKYRQRIWRLAYNILRDREEAWDVAQEAFIRAYQALPSFRGQSAFYTWLYRIVMNVAADRARSRGARSRACRRKTGIVCCPTRIRETRRPTPPPPAANSGARSSGRSRPCRSTTGGSSC